METEFLGLDRFNAVALVLKYKAYLLRERGLKEATVPALQAWLLARQELDINRPLFIALDRASYGHRLTMQFRSPTKLQRVPLRGDLRDRSKI